MAGLLDRFGLYGKQNMQVSEDYARSLGAQRSIITDNEAIDHRNMQAKLASPAGLRTAPVAGSLAFAAPQIPAAGSYAVGTKYSPTVGLTTSGGAVAAPAAVAPEQAPARLDGAPKEVTREDWDMMSPETQDNMFKLATQKDINTRGVRSKRITRVEYVASLPSRKLTAAGYLESTGMQPRTAAPSIDAPKHTNKMQALIDKIPQAMQTPQGQRITEFARAVGVNPAVAMATYGMESSFGAQNRSWDEASRTGSGWGVLQVTPATARGVVKHFSKPEVLAKYPNEANNLTALMRMASGDPNSEEAQIAAGVLQMKYIQDIGLTDESLMGAAYQANPHKVLKRGAPLDATDGGLTNSEYSSNWNALFGPASVALGGGARTNSPSAPQQPTAPAGLVKTGNTSFDSRVKFAVQKSPDEYSFQTQQLMQSREQNNQYIKQQQEMFAAEQQRIEQDYAQSSTRFTAYKAAGDVAGMTAEMDKMAGAQSLANDIQTRSFEFVISAQANIDAYNNQLIAAESDRAVRDLVSGDPARASALISSAGGVQRTYQARTDSGFSLIDQNGQYVLDDSGQARKFSPEEVAYELYSVADKAKAAAIDAGRASDASISRESRLKIEEEKVKIAGELAKIEVKSTWDLKQKLMELDADIAEVKDDGAGGFTVFYKGGSGKIVTYSPAAVQATVDGTEIPTSGIKVEYSGLNTNG